MITLTHFLVVSACIFCIGLYAVLAKRNAIMILVAIYHLGATEEHVLPCLIHV